MDTQLTIKSMQHQNWIEMVQQQIHSGLTVNEWCEKNDINPKTFWYRRRVVRNDLLGASSPFVEIPLPESKKTLPPTASMNTRIFSPEFQPVMRIDVNGATISLTSDTSRELLKDVLEVLKNA